MQGLVFVKSRAIMARGMYKRLENTMRQLLTPSKGLHNKNMFNFYVEFYTDTYNVYSKSLTVSSRTYKFRHAALRNFKKAPTTP